MNFKKLCNYVLSSLKHKTQFLERLKNPACFHYFGGRKTQAIFNRFKDSTYKTMRSFVFSLLNISALLILLYMQFGALHLQQSSILRDGLNKYLK